MEAEHAQPFVKIDDGKLKLVADVSLLATKPRIISILGKARMGKSTFLNAMVTQVVKENMSPFKTQDTLEHCTKGIDSYFLEKENILFLDSQGLAHQNSSHDPSLLLFIYLISDVIILNERMMLQNEALKLLEPICTFMTYVDIDEVVKPKLFFRISDGDMIKEPAENIATVMQHYQDQYQSIRDSITHLFQEDLHLVKTDTLDKRARLMLSTNDYQSLMKESGLGFEQAITHILKHIPSEGTCKVKLEVVIQQINDNEKIKIEKLDIVSMTAKSEIRDWLDENVPSSAFALIDVDGTQTCFEEKVEPRKALKKKILTAFTKKCKSLPSTLVGPFRQKLERELEEPIVKACEKSEELAAARVASYYAKCMEKREFMYTADVVSYTSQRESIRSSVLDRFIRFEKACEDIYLPVKTKHITFIECVSKVVDDELSQVCSGDSKRKCEINDVFEKKLDGFETSLIECIQIATQTKKNICVNHEKIIQYLTDTYYEDVKKDLNCALAFKRRFICQDGKMTIEREDTNTSFNPETYDLTRDMICAFKKTLDGFTKNQNVLSKVVSCKETVLFGKYILPGSFAARVRMINPEIQIVNIYRSTPHGGDLKAVSDILFGERNIHPQMTKETYEVYWLPLLEKTKAHLVLKGYCKEDTPIVEVFDARKEVQTSQGVQIEGYMKSLSEIFLNRLKKVYCQAVTEGFSMPSLLEEE